MDSNGDFIIAWENKFQDGSIFGVFAQLYSSSGLMQGSEFRVNTETGGLQAGPSVAMDGNGNFAVTWVSSDQDGDNYGIYAQRYTAPPCTPQNYYPDTDADGYGAGIAISSCIQPENTVADNTDCDDNNMAVHPGAPELCNNLDDDCNSRIDDNLVVCPAPSGLSTTDITSTTATLQWSEVPCAKKYKIKYIRLSPYIATNISAGIAGNASIEGLTPSSQYKWNIKSKCPNGILSTASNWQYFSTTGGELLQAGSDNPNAVMSSSLNQHTAEIILQPNPAIDNVRVVSSRLYQQITITDLTGRIVWQQMELNTNELDIDIHGLTPGLYYLYAQSGTEISVIPLVRMQ